MLCPNPSPLREKLGVVHVAVVRLGLVIECVSDFSTLYFFFSSFLFAQFVEVTQLVSVFLSEKIAPFIAIDVIIHSGAFLVIIVDWNSQ